MSSTSTILEILTDPIINGEHVRLRLLVPTDRQLYIDFYVTHFVRECSLFKAMGISHALAHFSSDRIDSIYCCKDHKNGFTAHDNASESFSKELLEESRRRGEYAFNGIIESPAPVSILAFSETTGQLIGECAARVLHSPPFSSPVDNRYISINLLKIYNSLSFVPFVICQTTNSISFACSTWRFYDQLLPLVSEIDRRGRENGGAVATPFEESAAHPVLEVRNLWVREDWRGVGLARALLQRTLMLGRAAGTCTRTTFFPRSSFSVYLLMLYFARD